MDAIVEKLSLEKLEQLLSRIKNISYNTRNHKKYSDILDYLEAKIELKLLWEIESSKAQIIPSTYNARVWEKINFSSEESYGRIITYVWNFWDIDLSLPYPYWDEHLSIEANPSHVYLVPWEYTVYLTVEIIGGTLRYDEVTINVSP